MKGELIKREENGNEKRIVGRREKGQVRDGVPSRGRKTKGLTPKAVSGGSLGLLVEP